MKLLVKQIGQNQLQEIAQWTSDIRHLAGKLNNVTDWLSRPSDDVIADTTTIKIVTQSNQGVISFDFDCGLIKIKGLIMINFPYSKS